MRRVILQIPLLLLLLLAGAGTAAAATVEEYHDRVAQALDEAASIDFYEDPLAARASLERIRELLPPEETIETPQGSYTVDNRWVPRYLDVIAGGQDDDERMEAAMQLYTRLQLLDTHIEAILGTAPPHASAEERARLEEILSRAEFRDTSEDPIAKAVRYLRERLIQTLQWIQQKLFGGAGGQSVTTVLRVVIVGLGLVGLVLLVRFLAQAAARRRSGAVKGTKVVLGEEIDESKTSADLAAEARALAAKGDYRLAIRKLFVALIYQLDERGLVTLRAEATNREYLALVRNRDRLFPLMTAMTNAFERVWYGEAPAGRDEFEAFEQNHAKASRIVDSGN